MYEFKKLYAGHNGTETYLNKMFNALGHVFSQLAQGDRTRWRTKVLGWNHPAPLPISRPLSDMTVSKKWCSLVHKVPTYQEPNRNTGAMTFKD